MYTARDTQGKEEENQARAEKDSQRQKAYVEEGRFRQGEYDVQQADQAKAEDCGALAENVVDTEVFARFFRGNNLGEVGAGKGLHSALETADGYGKDPELPFIRQEYDKDTDCQIAADTNDKELTARYFRGKLPKDKRAGEGYDLGNEQRDYEFYHVKAQAAADRHCHFNNRMYTVDIEEVCDQEKERFFILRQFFKDTAKTF